jgi:large subunit ribosomal protein L4
MVAEQVEQIEITIHNSSGKKAGKQSIPSTMLPAALTTPVIHQVVRWQRSKKRAGTHNVKTRAEVRGGGAKPWKQKGTGNARAGSNTSPLWVGGGVAHGPKQKSYEFSLNKKERKKALQNALSLRHQEGRLVLVDDFGLNKASTKGAVAVLEALGIAKGDSVLVIVPDMNEINFKSLRNIKGVKAILPAGLNVYDILAAKYLVLVGDSFELVKSRLGAVEG